MALVYISWQNWSQNFEVFGLSFRAVISLNFNLFQFLIFNEFFGLTMSHLCCFSLMIQMPNSPFIIRRSLREWEGAKTMNRSTGRSGESGQSNFHHCTFLNHYPYALNDTPLQRRISNKHEHSR